jgi:hypothetical protein
MADKDFKVKSGLDLGTPLPITEGGTGQTSANNALNALLPLQTGNSGKVLSTNGTDAAWAADSTYAAPTIGSTSIASGATVATIEGLTLTTPVITQGTSTPSFTTNAYTLVAGDAGRMLLASNSTTAGTIKIPTNASVPFATGTQITIIQTGSGQLTVTATTPATTTILSTGGTAASPKCRAQYSALTAIKVSSDLWYIVGDIS